MEKSETNDKLSLLKVSSGLQPEHFDFPQPCNGNLTMTNNSSTYCIESGYIRTGNTCGLTMTQNETHVSFISKLQLKQFQEDNFDDLDASYWFDSAVSGMKSMFSPIIPFQCTFPVNEYVRGDFRPIYTEQEIIEEGRYAAEILLYKTEQYQSIHVANPTMDAFDEFGMTTRVNAEVRLQNATHAENIAIQINRCWATPTNDPTVEELILVTDGCPHQPQNELEDMNTLVSNSGDGISARFQFDVFGFTSSAAVHIHCAIEICSVANSFECRRTSPEACDAESRSGRLIKRDVNEFGIGSFVEPINQVVITAGPIEVNSHEHLKMIGDGRVVVKPISITDELDFLAIRKSYYTVTQQLYLEHSSRF